MMKHLQIPVVLALLFTLSIGQYRSVAQSEVKAVNVSATDPRIRYVGRFDLREAGKPRCAWSASTVEIRFTGSLLDAVINEQGDDSLSVDVDGAAPTVLKLTKGVATYHIVQDLGAGVHTVRLVKRTEAFVGVTQYVGFQLSANGALRPFTNPPKRKLEVIGDSISCGYGNEGKSKAEHFTVNTENAASTYGAIAAKRLGADYMCVAWSGRKMWPDNTIPEIYNRTLPNDASSLYEPKNWRPDVILINLATNDFNSQNPERTSWVKAYRDFIHRLRANAPKAAIYLASGPMMSDEWPASHKALSTLKSYLHEIIEDEAKAGDKGIREIDFAHQQDPEGIGADWHPNVKTHTIMADKLATVVEKDLGWKQAK